MLKKKCDINILKVIKKLENIFCNIDFTKTNIGGRKFSIIQNKCSLWKWNHNYVSICISGGLNNCGNWSDYLRSLQETIELIENTWEDVFIDKIESDTLDDIFYATIIIRIQ